MNQKPFQNAERDFFLLKGQLATNRLTREQFDAGLQKLNVRDEYGRAWRIEPENGAWQIQQNDAWVAADPKTYPAPDTSSSAQTKSSSNSIFVFAALGVFVFLCVCGIGAYALLNLTGVISTTVNVFRTATPTLSAFLTTTPTAPETPLVTSQAFTPTSIESATPSALTPNRTVVATPVLPASFVAFDADFFGDPCPLFEGDNETRAYACGFGEYTMLHKQPSTRYSYDDAEYADAVLEATGYLKQGSGKYEYGVIVRGNTEGTQYYVFTVTNDGKYNVALYKDDKYTDLIPYTESTYVNTGTEANKFRVVMSGTQLIFYLNDEFIGIVPDNTLGHGVVGLFFYNDTAGTQVGFDQLTIWTFTAPTPTPVVAPNVTATPTPAASLPTAVSSKPGVYVNSLRFSPRAPKRGQPVTFFATFVNSTGRAQNYKWLVEIWEQDANKKNRYGQADGLQQQIPVGTNERATGDSWKVAGGGPCIPFRARVVYQDDQSRAIPFKQTNGADLWVNFQVCP